MKKLLIILFIIPAMCFISCKPEEANGKIATVIYDTIYVHPDSVQIFQNISDDSTIGILYPDSTVYLRHVYLPKFQHNADSMHVRGDTAIFFFKNIIDTIVITPSNLKSYQ